MSELPRYIDTGIIHSVHPDMENPETVHATFREVGFVVLSAELFSHNDISPTPNTKIKVEHNRVHVLTVLETMED